MGSPPRTRGEGNDRVLRLRRQGITPRTRGEAGINETLATVDRITPAYAGRSGFEPYLCRLPEDHPRVRGEKLMVDGALGGHPGSPPRTRGEERLRSQRGHREGITPAYAGRSDGGQKCGVEDEDHPRVRGEKRCVALGSPRQRGSPPRTRGEVGYDGHMIASDRITPAYAGRSRPIPSS